jgi:K+-sensing histidine kinase KdpD
MKIMDEILITVDWNMIDQAVGFLIENALEHSPPGATVGIKTQVKDGFIQIEVSDQGKGVEPELIDKIFDGCRCLQNLAQMDDCKGFSLALAKRILELHDGSISAFNNPIKGVTFYITLPLHTVP